MKRTHKPSGKTKVEPVEERWAIGTEEVVGQFGVTHGPYDSEKKALNVIGEEGFKIVHFKPNRTHKIIWRWSLNRGCWISLKHEIQKLNKKEIKRKKEIRKTYSKEYIDLATKVALNYEVNGSYLETTWKKGEVLLNELEKLCLKLTEDLPY